MAKTLTSGLVGLLAMAILALTADAAEPGAVRDGRVEAELIAQHAALVPGETARVGLRLQMDNGWHTYWKNPGDSGMTTLIDWDLPDGFVAHEIDWPAPEYFEVSGLASFAYEGEIVLPVRIEVPADFTGSDVTLRATADWLVCKEQCEPGSAALSMTLPVVQNPANVLADTTHRDLFAWAAARQPRAMMDGHVTANRQGDVFTLAVREALPRVQDASATAARFFPAGPMSIAMSEPQSYEASEDRSIRLTLAANTFTDPPERLQGVLVLRRGEQLQPIKIDVPLRDVAGGGTK